MKPVVFFLLGVHCVLLCNAYGVDHGDVSIQRRIEQRKAMQRWGHGQTQVTDVAYISPAVPYVFFSEDSPDIRLSGIQLMCGDSLFHVHYNNIQESCNAYAVLNQYLDKCIDLNEGNVLKVKKQMILASLFGCEVDGEEITASQVDYYGPYWRCVKKILKECAFSSSSLSSRTRLESSFEDALILYFPRELEALLMTEDSQVLSGYPRGRYCDNGIEFDYEINIQWTNDIPSSIRVTIDFSSMAPYIRKRIPIKR